MRSTLLFSTDKKEQKKKKKERKSVIGTWCEAFDWLGIESG